MFIWIEFEVRLIWTDLFAFEFNLTPTWIQVAFELKLNETWLQALHVKLNWISIWFEVELEVTFLLNSGTGIVTLCYINYWWWALY
jgi:hypothetical protein